MNCLWLVKKVCIMVGPQTVIADFPDPRFYNEIWQLQNNKREELNAKPSAHIAILEYDANNARGYWPRFAVYIIA